MDKKIHAIHFVGIKGVGMAPLAIIAKEAGMIVTGSDVDQMFITDAALEKAGIVPEKGFAAKHVGDVGLVITTGAHGGFDNVEVFSAKERTIPVWTQGEAVGKFMEGVMFGRNLQGISVTGSHGKTTTTAMIATVLKTNHLDPSWIVGTGSVPSLGSAGHYGNGNWFVAEADEYMAEPKYDRTPKLLWQHPKIAVITNIELDHPDVYKTVDDVRDTMLQFANQLPEDGLLVTCGDDPEVRKMLANFDGRKVTYGFGNENEYVIGKWEMENRKWEFELRGKGEVVGRFAISVAGKHNALNATAAVIVGLEVGLSIEQIQKGLSQFTGSRRRMEFIGKLADGTLLYDDYAHHPTEIKKTLDAFREQFPDRRLLCIFQPHTYSRTKALLPEFAEAFGSVDEVVIVDIFPSAREEPDPTISSEVLAQEIGKYQKNIEYGGSLDDVKKLLLQRKFGENNVLITMGAGDVYTIAASLLPIQTG